MVCLGFKPEAAGWKAQTNPLSYGSTQSFAVTHFCDRNSFVLTVHRMF